MIGVAGLAQGLLDQLGVAAAMDATLPSQPTIGASYGRLAEAVIINRMTLDPQPLYRLSGWAEQHGIDRLLGIEASWLDDDRVGGLLCSNGPADRCSAPDLVIRHQGQIGVEQTIDCLTSPVQLRPLWLHSPRRIAGLTLLIMLAVLLAALVEHRVRAWIARTGALVQGVMPDTRDTARPTATALLRTFQDYAVVLIHQLDGTTTVHASNLRPVQQHIWSILDLPPLLLEPQRAGSGKYVRWSVSRRETSRSWETSDPSLVDWRSMTSSACAIRGTLGSGAVERCRRVS